MITKIKQVKGLKGVKKYGKVTYVSMIRRKRSMNNFQGFLKQNNNTIRNIASKNPTVITKDDEWREESAWDDIYERGENNMENLNNTDGKKVAEALRFLKEGFMKARGITEEDLAKKRLEVYKK